MAKTRKPKKTIVKASSYCSVCWGVLGISCKCEASK